MLKRAAMVTQQKLLSGEWSPTVAKSHLKENGINEGYRNLIVRQGGNRRTFDLMKEKAERGGAGVVELAAWQKIQKEKELFPTKYFMPKTPSLWNRDLLLRLFVDTPMHLLFLGIAKSIFGKISLWSAQYLPPFPHITHEPYLGQPSSYLSLSLSSSSESLLECLQSHGH
jgi:hypothetical protein